MKDKPLRTRPPLQMRLNQLFFGEHIIFAPRTGVIAIVRLNGNDHPVLDMGFDPIWFGVIITLVMEMSLITPPVGINVFIISGIAKDVPMYTIFRGVLPFWVAILVCIVLLILYPQIALFLPITMTQ